MIWWCSLTPRPGYILTMEWITQHTAHSTPSQHLVRHRHRHLLRRGREGRCEVTGPTAYSCPSGALGRITIMKNIIPISKLYTFRDQRVTVDNKWFTNLPVKSPGVWGGWGVMVQFMNIYHKQDILDFMEFDITNLLNVLRSQFTFPQLKIFVETFAMQKFEWS